MMQRGCQQNASLADGYHHRRGDRSVHCSKKKNTTEKGEASKMSKRSKSKSKSKSSMPLTEAGNPSPTLCMGKAMGKVF